MRMLTLLVLVLGSLNVVAEQKIYEVKGNSTSYSTDSLKWVIVFQYPDKNPEVGDITNKDLIRFGPAGSCMIGLEQTSTDKVMNSMGKDVRHKTARCKIFDESFDLHTVCFRDFKTNKRECGNLEFKKMSDRKIFIKGFESSIK